MSSTKLQSMLPTRQLFDDDQTLSYSEFFECFRRICFLKDAQIAVGLQVTCHHIWTKKTIHKTLAWLKASSLKASRSIVTVSAAVFPEGSKTWCKHVLLSLPSKNRRKQWQRLKKKSHTDRVDPSPRMPHGQLMQQAVMYAHQAGAGGTNAPLPSRK